MTEPRAIAAQVVDIKNDARHKGFISVTLHIPYEGGEKLTRALGWPTYEKPVPVALARLIESAKGNAPADAGPAPVVNDQPQAGPAPKRNRLTMRAAILSNDPLFHRYLEHEIKDTEDAVKFDKESAAAYIRTFCGVDSRREIMVGSPAATRFDLLESGFICWRDEP